jgi:hypothetical protein
MAALPMPIIPGPTFLPSNHRVVRPSAIDSSSASVSGALSMYGELRFETFRTTHLSLRRYAASLSHSNVCRCVSASPKEVDRVA